MICSNCGKTMLDHQPATMTQRGEIIGDTFRPVEEPMVQHEDCGKDSQWCSVCKEWTGHTIWDHPTDVDGYPTPWEDVS